MSYRNFAPLALALAVVLAPTLTRADSIGPCPPGQHVVGNPTPPGSMHHGGFHCEPDPAGVPVPPPPPPPSVDPASAAEAARAAAEAEAAAARAAAEAALSEAAARAAAAGAGARPAGAPSAPPAAPPALPVRAPTAEAAPPAATGGCGCGVAARPRGLDAPWLALTTLALTVCGVRRRSRH